MMAALTDLFAKFDLVPNNIAIFERAFTHPSHNAETVNTGGDYERLEFMGDAIIALVVAELVFRSHPDFDQGMMSKTRAKLVQTDSLFRISKRLELHQYVRIGHSISRELVATSKKIMEDVFEAFMGAIFIDQGYEVAKRVSSSLFETSVADIDVAALTDFKTQLQEAIQAEHREAVTYTVEEEKGPAHDRHFTVAVSFGGTVLGRGAGSSKKVAEQRAAEAALSKKAG